MTLTDSHTSSANCEITVILSGFSACYAVWDGYDMQRMPSESQHYDKQEKTMQRNCVISLWSMQLFYRCGLLHRSDGEIWVRRFCLSDWPQKRFKSSKNVCFPRGNLQTAVEIIEQRQIGCQWVAVLWYCDVGPATWIVTRVPSRLFTLICAQNNSVLNDGK